MKTGKPSAPTIGRRLRRTLGALLAIGFATTWWTLVPPHESVASAAPPTTVTREAPEARVVVIPIPVILPFALPTAPTSKVATPKPVQARHRPHVPQVAIVDPPTRQPFALPPPPDVPTPPVEDPPAPVDDPTTAQPPTDTPTKNPEPRIRTRSS